MGGCAHKERFILPTPNHPNQHLPTEFQCHKISTHNREILLKPNIYLSATTKIKIDGSLTRVDTKEHLERSEVDVICNLEGTTEQDKGDRTYFLLKQTQSYYVEQQNHSQMQLRIEGQSHLLEESMILDKKQDNLPALPQGNSNPRKYLQNADKNMGREQRGKNA